MRMCTFSQNVHPDCLHSPHWVINRASAAEPDSALASCLALQCPVSWALTSQFRKILVERRFRAHLSLLATAASEYLLHKLYYKKIASGGVIGSYLLHLLDFLGGASHALNSRCYLFTKGRQPSPSSTKGFTISCG